MKAVAFAPGHISCFFEPYYNETDFLKTGSRGAGININLGCYAEVEVLRTDEQIIEFEINGKKNSSKICEIAVREIIGDNKLNVKIKTECDLPFSQGFGMSAAIALSSTYALTKILRIPRYEAMKASHIAEVELKTGLGDVISSCFGGVELRKKPGLPPWGSIEHIPGNYEIIICIIGPEIDTRNILSDNKKMTDFFGIGNYCIKKLIEKPTFENLLRLSKLFTNKSNLASEKIKNAIQECEKYGSAGMCMLGNSIFAYGNTEKLLKILQNHGKTHICNVDEKGARVL